MKVTKCERDENGNISFSVFATDQETSCLINIALEALVAIGAVPDNLDGEFEIDLESLPIEDMFKA